MTWNLALYAFASVFTLTILLSVVGVVSRSAQNGHPIETYLLAGSTLKRFPIINLLLSASFSLNGFFYPVWFGFTIGAWGMIMQIAWVCGFFLLAPHASEIQKRKSLHDWLGWRFEQPATRVIAGLCSMIGIMYLMGWEAEIGRQTLSSLFSSTAEMTVEQSMVGATWFVSAIVLGCLLYTVLGGLRGNAWADILLNSMKLITLGVLTCLLLDRFTKRKRSPTWP